LGNKERKDKNTERRKDRKKRRKKGREASRRCDTLFSSSKLFLITVPEAVKS
jgi:hypothetical protein